MWLKTYIFGIICGLLYTNKFTSAANNFYFGTKLGSLTQLHHGVSGDVYAVDSRTLFLKNFNYDGEGPAAYFYVGNSRRPSNIGAYRLRDERGSTGVIKRYRNKDITLSLPEGKTLRDFKWFSVWCDEFSVNFGDVTIPKNLDYPRPHKVNALSGVHGVSSDNIVIVDAQTLLIPNFSYDGEAPDAKFWVGRGPKPSPQGIRIPDENGKEKPLRRYDKKTIVLTLPGDLTVFDIGHFGVWCEAFTVDFGHVRIPEAVNVPPSLRMLGISPQSKLNCEVLYDDLAYEVRWAVAGESIVVQLVAKLDDNEYMSFGISPDLGHTQMVGADVAVAWVERETGKGYAHDYYLDAKSQCSGTRGSCPDTRIEQNTNSIRLLNAAMVNGYSIVTYQRPLKAADRYDLPIIVNGTQAIVWAVGPLNQRSEVSYHSKYTKGDRFIDFGRQPFWNCPMPDADKVLVDDDIQPEYYQPIHGNKYGGDDTRRQTVGYLPTQKPIRRPATPQPAAKEGAWVIPPIQCDEPDDGVFYAQMGPTGGKHGYPAITGHVGWGISWYINGLLIPEINVVRGRNYTFVTEGGIDPEVPAKYHPFYITDDSVGGYEHKTDEEKAKVKIFAGVKRTRSGEVIPTGTGRLCNWTPDIDGPTADEYASFGAYQRSLTLKCDQGEPGIVHWSPDHKTPDTVYYQCFTHRYLGWRINVLDECDDYDAEGSELDEVYTDVDDDEGFQAESSIRHESKLRPQDQYLLAHDKDTSLVLNTNESTKDTELESNSEISKLISDGIKAAEELEKSIANEPKFNTTRHTPLQYNQGEIDESVTNDQRPPPPHEPEIQTQSKRPGGLPLFLRPPQNYMNGPIRPVKLPIRRPITYERRPVPYPQRPIIVPQPSMLISHYKKPVPAFMRPFVKQKPVPIKSIASLLLLGEPTEIAPPATPQPITYHYQPPQPQQKQSGGQMVPLPDFQIVAKKKQDIPFLFPLKEKKAAKPQYYEKPVLQKTSSSSYDMKKGTVESVSLDLKPAINNGFSPGSVIVESGFRPIVRSDDGIDENGEMANRRRDDDVSDIDEAIGSDALLINREMRREEEANKQFEPMFIPSPLDSVTNAKKAKAEFENKYPNHKPEHLSGDLRDMEVEDGEDKMAVAAERQDTYYLPPDNRRPSQIYPEGTVVAYDGKAVLDTSLVSSAPASVASQNIYADVSRTEQLIRDTPQFVPFRGEIPPLIPEFIPKDSIQFTLNRNGPQSPVTEYLNPLSNTRNRNLNQDSPAGTSTPISTKLTLLGANERNFRTRREARPHHTPDHHGDGHDDDHEASHTPSSSALPKITNQFLCLSLITLLYFRLGF